MVIKTIDPDLKLKLVRMFLILTTFGIVYGLYYLHSLASNVQASKVKVAEAERDLALLDTARANLHQYASEISQLRHTLPSKYYEVAYFTSQLERLSNNYGLNIQISLDKNPREENQSYNSIAYSLNIEGNYSSVTTFLGQVYRLPFHTAIDSLNMSHEEGRLLTEIKFRLFLEK